jgi:hypothetical protein
MEDSRRRKEEEMNDKVLRNRLRKLGVNDRKTMRIALALCKAITPKKPIRLWEIRPRDPMFRG